MNIEKIEKKYYKAIELINGEKYASTLKAELTKPEWKEKVNEIIDRVDSIGSKGDFEKYSKQLVNLFEEVYEKITAPGLDAFIAWVDAHTKNQENVKKLRFFIKQNYETYSTSIDGIISTIESLPQEDEKHLFDSLLNEFNRKIKKEVTSFINDADKFENNIDGFLSTLKSEYSGMAMISELEYTSIEQLYTEEQRKYQNRSFYEDIIKKAISCGQSLGQLDDAEKDIALNARALKRIKSIKKCVSILIQTGMSECKDNSLQNLFLRFDKEMLSVNGDIAQTLSNYFEKTWEPLENKYKIIQDFYSKDALSFNESDWSGFEKEADITALFNDYNSVRKGNILSLIPAMKLEDVSSKINTCYKKITDLAEKENKTGEIVREYFQEFVTIYNNKKQMLDKIIKKHANLKNEYDEIFEQGKSMTTLTNGIVAIKADNSFLRELGEGTIYDMIEDMKKIKGLFLEILKQSQMEEQINWLNNLNSTNISENDFKADFLQTLIKEGLITLSFKKEF